MTLPRFPVRTILLLSLLTVVTACAGRVEPPRLLPLDEAGREALQNAAGPVPAGNGRIVHAIEARLPGGITSLMMGVTLVSPSGLRCVLMTPEGLVLFDAEDPAPPGPPSLPLSSQGRGTGGGVSLADEPPPDDDIQVHRAVAPFTGKSFGRGMIADIRMTTFPPNRPPDDIGQDAEGWLVRRYDDGAVVTDILPTTDGWILRRYLEGRLIRDITARRGAGDPVDAPPRFIELNAPDRGYRLRLTLISTEPLSGESP